MPSLLPKLVVDANTANTGGGDGGQPRRKLRISDLKRHCVLGKGSFGTVELVSCGAPGLAWDYGGGEGGGGGGHPAPPVVFAAKHMRKDVVVAMRQGDVAERERRVLIGLQARPAIHCRTLTIQIPTATPRPAMHCRAPTMTQRVAQGTTAAPQQ